MRTVTSTEARSQEDALPLHERLPSYKFDVSANTP